MGRQYTLDKWRTIQDKTIGVSTSVRSLKIVQCGSDIRQKGFLRLFFFCGSFYVVPFFNKEPQRYTEPLRLRPRRTNSHLECLRKFHQCSRLSIDYLEFVAERTPKVTAEKVVFLRDLSCFQHREFKIQGGQIRHHIHQCMRTDGRWGQREF